MKLLVLGSTGKTGQEVVTQALAQGHEVTVLVRSPEKIHIKDPRLHVVKGDALDKTVVSQVLEGQDAVISSLGVGSSFKSGSLISNAARILVPAMEALGIKRLIFTSAFGVGKTYAQANFFQKLFFNLALRDIYADKGAADELIMNSNLDWTIVFPVKMTDGKKKDKIRHGENLPMPGMPVISRADTAAFLLSQLNDPAYLKKCPIIMNG